jgi:hypothetical protein
MLFVGWLASRLAWEASSFFKEKEKSALAQFDKDGKTITVEFNSTEISHVAPGSIFEIEIDLDAGKKLRIARDPAGEAGSLMVVVSQDGKRIREVIADDTNLDRVHLMGFELDDLGEDPIFEQSLESAYKLLRLLEGE